MRRLLNEDSFVAEGSIFVVADGMGGHEAGDVASAAAIEAVRPLVGLGVLAAEDVVAHLEIAQAAVRSIDTAAGRGAGTTFTGVVVAEQDGEPYWLVVNVGDSRTYQMSGGCLEQVSVDHSEVEELVAAGTITRAEAATHPRRHVVTRALGSWPAPEPDLWYVPMVPGDRMVVCSDGLTGELADARIAEVLREHAGPQEAADALVAEALAAGGRDNVTVVVVDVVAERGRAGADAAAAVPGAEDPWDDTLPRENREMEGVG
ncbi:PP2C family protein-serine/threonine phosphatase [Sediminihabitans luteus]|nr:protein phosphatase 2C domain-containing protein [Sediminihabitans luteus]